MLEYGELLPRRALWLEENIGAIRGIGGAVGRAGRCRLRIQIAARIRG